MTTAGTQGYGEDAAALSMQYESISFEDVHALTMHLHPASPARILDIGAGTGRDAAALAVRGHAVIAVEPTRALREFGQKHHAAKSITWLDDQLPVLAETVSLGLTFDLILLTAVLMHLDWNDRKVAMAVLSTLLAPEGQLILSLRHGPIPEGRVMYDVTDGEMLELAQVNRLSTVFLSQKVDMFARPGVSWSVHAMKSGRVVS